MSDLEAILRNSVLAALEQEHLQTSPTAKWYAEQEVAIVGRPLNEKEWIAGLEAAFQAGRIYEWFKDEPEVEP